MNGALLGSKYFVSAGKGDHTRHGPGSPSVRNIVSPCSSAGRPRLSRYQALSFAGSFALKKMPPTPRTRSMVGERTCPSTPLSTPPLLPTRARHQEPGRDDTASSRRVPQLHVRKTISPNATQEGPAVTCSVTLGETPSFAGGGPVTRLTSYW